VQRLLLLIAFAACAFAQSYSATLVWADTANPAGTDYNVYRLTGTCPATVTSTAGFTKLTATALAVKTYVDNTVAAGITYAYVVTATNGSSETGPSNCAQGVIPSLFVPQTLQITIVQ
jgi:hypothetical protein